jgi:hypothetical protein
LKEFDSFCWTDET